MPNSHVCIVLAPPPPLVECQDLLGAPSSGTLGRGQVLVPIQALDGGLASDRGRGQATVAAQRHSPLQTQQDARVFTSNPTLGQRRREPHEGLEGGQDDRKLVSSIHEELLGLKRSHGLPKTIRSESAWKRSVAGVYEPL
jgi:hypothetical protein